VIDDQILIDNFKKELNCWRRLHFYYREKYWYWHLMPSNKTLNNQEIDRYYTSDIQLANDLERSLKFHFQLTYDAFISTSLSKVIKPVEVFDKYRNEVDQKMKDRPIAAIKPPPNNKSISGNALENQIVSETQKDYLVEMVNRLKNIDQEYDMKVQKFKNENQKSEI
jgi:hypothetical protein